MIIDADQLNAGVAMLHKYLSEGIVEVTFTKKDGNTRVMLGTTLGTLIPEEKKPKQKPLASFGIDEAEVISLPKVAPTQHIVMFDTEKQEWRSCNYTTIKTIKLHQRRDLIPPL